MKPHAKYRTPPNACQVKLSFKVADPFGTWATKFFNKRLNSFVPVREAYNHFVEFTAKSVTRLEFKRALTSWCYENGYTLDPKEHRNSGDRIIRKKEVKQGRWLAMEMIYIQNKTF